MKIAQAVPAPRPPEDLRQYDQAIADFMFSSPDG